MNSIRGLFFTLGALSGFIAMAPGAFAAHGLKFGGAALLAGWLCLAWAAWKA